MHKRLFSALPATLILAIVALAPLWAQAPYYGAPAPRLFRLPPVDDEPVAPAPAPPANQTAPQAPANESAATPQPAVETLPAPPIAPSPSATDAKVEEKEATKEEKKEEEKRERPLDKLVDNRYVPEPLREYWRQWDASIEFGLQGTEGNSTTFNMRAGGKAERKSGPHQHTIEFTHIDNSKEGIKTALSTLIDTRYERQFGTTKWNYYAHSFTEFDEFKAFDVRISADTGLGYQWLKTDLARLLTRVGASASHEIGGPNEGYTPEVTSGIEWKHKLSDRQNVYAKIDYFPDVTNFQDFRLNSKAEWEMIVSKTWGLSLKMSMIDRYDSTPEGARPNDLNYAVLLLWAL